MREELERFVTLQLARLLCLIHIHSYINVKSDTFLILILPLTSYFLVNPFNKYMVLKPDKFVIKFWLLVDIKSEYLCNDKPY